jgi:hypothetical protein
VKSVKYITSLLFLALTVLLMAACGGGGGGSDDAVPDAPAAGVSITTENASLVTADVLATVGLVEGFQLAEDLLPAVQVEAAGTEFSYPDFIVDQLQRLGGQVLASANDGIVNAATITPIPEPCDNNNGTITISGEVAIVYPEYIPSEGDVINIRFSDCELEDIVLNGQMSITITSLSPNFDFIPPYTLGVDVVMTVFSMDYGGEVISTDGDMSMLLSEDEVGYRTMDVSGNSLTAWSGGEVETLTNYWYYLTLNSALPEPVYTYELEGALASTVIGGSVSFQMIKPGTTDPSEPFEGVDAGDPYNGELWITTSADASGVHITALSNSETVLIDLYADINDAIIEVITTTWEELRCLLDPEAEACLIQ